MNNKKDVKVMLKEAAILFVITLFAGLMLGFVYELTKEPIAIQKEKKIKEACNAVFPEANSFEEITIALDEELVAELKKNGIVIGTVYSALSDTNEALGYVIASTTKKGYGGDIEIYVGISNDGTINDISILKISETPGLGMRAKDVLVPQLHNMKADEVVFVKTGKQSENEIDAISGATITTRAITNAVNGAIKVKAFVEQGGVANE